MKKSLLGHLYSHIKGSAEDVATLSLQYLLTAYDELNISFNMLLTSKLQLEIDKNTSYTCQSVGDEKERPDMSGKDSKGNEIVLCEMKFYAGLTSNQPLTYLKRLKKNNGKALIVVCPKERMISLWETLLSKCVEEKTEQIEQYYAKVNGIGMLILSWDEILSNLIQTANAVEKESLSDIEQLKGYCEMIASNSFKPFKEEDLGAENAKRYEQYMYILDRVVDSLLADSRVEVSLKGVKATPHRHGYKRFMMINNYATDLRFDLDFWADDRYIDTPYWISFRDQNWKPTKQIIESTEKVSAARKVPNHGRIYLAIDVLCNTYEEELVENIKEQIIAYLSEIEQR